MNYLDIHFVSGNAGQMSRGEPLGQTLGDALTSSLTSLHDHTPPPESFSSLSQGEIDEFNGLRDAQDGNLCLGGQTEAYYEGYSFGYQEGEY